MNSNSPECEEKDVDLLLIGAGLSRTGTMSTRAALEVLLGPCYHGAVPFIEKQSHQPLWKEAYKKGKLDKDIYQKILSNYKAGLDLPFMMWYKELINLNPNAKVLLTVRDPKKWYLSCRNSIRSYQEMADTWPGSWFHTLIGFGPSIEFLHLVGQWLEKPELGMSLEKALENEETAIQFFEEHTDEVKRLVPKERLLVFEVQQGWGPLCNFLGLPEPQTPFPNVNDTAKILFIKRVVSTLSWVVVVGLPVFLGILGLFVVQDMASFSIFIGLGLAIFLFAKYLFFNMLNSHIK